MANAPDLRQRNLGLVLTEICRRTEVGQPPPSRAQVTRRTALHKTTVSQLTDELIAAGLVTELSSAANGLVGRPSQPLVPAPGALAALGLEVNVDYLGLAAVDLTGQRLAERFDSLDLRRSDPSAVLDGLADLARDMAHRLERYGTRIAGAGLALPGLT
ncbi:MAG: hypothetical protein LBG11_06530, partial [Bifidobacteriaceae bacterium]|nr:hypothetical protein [Bifidobacteriaceae bacterium]